MPRFRPVPLALAWRDARASGGKFFFVILAVAIGVGALTGVRGFSRAFGDALLRDARKLMAADLSVRTFAPPTDEQQQRLDDLARRGARITTVTETLSMMSANTMPSGATTPPPAATRAPERPQSSGPPVMVSLKAVDPAFYPFYGEVKLDPPMPLRTALSGNSVAVSDDLLMRLHLITGDSVRIGAADFRITAVVRQEPDRMTGTLNVGPRVMLSRAALDQTGLMKFGSRASYRTLVSLGSVNVDYARRRLTRVFGIGSRVVDYRQAHPAISRGLEQATTFLSLVGLIALIVSGLGVAMALNSHLQQKMDSIAILKCLGASSRQVVEVYLIEVLALGLAGSAAGIGLGYIVQSIFPRLIANYFSLPVEIHWASRAALEGVAVGVLSTLLFTLPALLEVRGIKPLMIFRREMAETPQWTKRLRSAWSALAAGGVIFAGLAGIAVWLAGSRRMGLVFVGGLLTASLALSAVAWLLLRALRAIPVAFTRLQGASRLPPPLRHGLANLHRPGSHASAVLVALGIGVTFTLTLYLVQHSLLKQIFAGAPPDMPNVFLINITDREREGVERLLRSQPGVQDARPAVPLVSGRLMSVDGTAIDRLGLEGWARRFQGSRYVTWASERPRHVEVIDGEWWQASPGAAEVAVEEEVARTLHVRPGSMLRWQMGTKEIPARVAATYRAEATRFGSGAEFVFSPGALDGLPAIYYASVRVRPEDVAALQRAAFEHYPTITVINAAEVLQTVQQVIDQIALVIRFISAFAILAGVIILSASVAGTRFRRIREVSILKTLGATRSLVARIFSVEFLILGLVAGLAGSILATGLSNILLRRFLDAKLDVSWRAALAATILTALLANLAGWMASFRILGQKPLEILRRE